MSGELSANGFGDDNTKVVPDYLYEERFCHRNRYYIVGEKLYFGGKIQIEAKPSGFNGHS